MASQPPPYHLFNLRPSAAQTNMHSLVSASWCGLFCGQYCGPNLWLDQIFAILSHQPEVAILQLCPYYFDQVTYSLPNRDLTRHMETFNLQLPWFNSWANLQQEKQMAAKKGRRLHLRMNQDVPHTTGMYLSRLCKLQDCNTGRSLTTRQYIHQMYGYSV